MGDFVRITTLNEMKKLPKLEELELKFSKEAIKELEALFTHYPNKKAVTLPALWIAQREYNGEITGEAIAEVAYRLGRSYAEVEGVATFYTMYNTEEKVGKHKIEVCTCVTCQVCDGYKVLGYLEKKLGIKVGETTSDGMFTLGEVECLCACDRAPVIQVGCDYHGPVNEVSLDKLIDDLAKKKESTVIEQANAIVQVQLRDSERA